MKIIKTITLLVLSLAFVYVIIVFETKSLPVGSSLAGLLLGFLLPATVKSFQDLSDTTNWEASQRKLLRGGIIKPNTIVRISFAYLYRIKVGNEYLLVKNARGTKKYQPVGGVYKLQGSEKIELKNMYHVVDDDKVPIDESSRDDYRLQMPCRYLRKFVRRFNSIKASRERIDNAGREFREELSGLLNWNHISYRYCGRHITELKFSEHFQCYELLLADIIELLPTKEQESDLENLKNNPSDYYRFASGKEIRGLGIISGTNKLFECIADHSKKILQEDEQELIKEPGVGKIFEINL